MRILTIAALCAFMSVSLLGMEKRYSDFNGRALERKLITYSSEDWAREYTSRELVLLHTSAIFAFETVDKWNLAISKKEQTLLHNGLKNIESAIYLHSID